MVLHPDFERNRLIYFSYSENGPKGVGTEAARARLAGRQLEDLQVIFRMEPKSVKGHTKKAWLNRSTLGFPLSLLRE